MQIQVFGFSPEQKSYLHDDFHYLNHIYIFFFLLEPTLYQNVAALITLSKLQAKNIDNGDLLASNTIKGITSFWHK